MEELIETNLKMLSESNIPDGWHIFNIDQIYEYINTPSYSREDLTFEKTQAEVYYIHYGDIHATFESEILDFDNPNGVPFLKDERCSGSFNYLRDGDLVIADASEDYEGVGECIELKNIRNKKVIGGLHTIVLRSKSTLTTNGFNAYIFKNPQVRNSLKKIATGISVYSLSKGNLSKLKILLPPVKEQNAIATALNLMDINIDKINQLVSQKELQKKGLMQLLLTGKERLRGFNKDWKEVRLGDVTNNFSRRNKGLSNARIYSVTNTNGFVFQSDQFEREVAGDDLTNYKIIRKNEFAYNPARINVGSIAYFNDDVGIISSLYVCFSTKNEILDYFLEQILKLDHTKHKISSYGEGGVRIYLWYDLFAKIKIKIPAVEEQTAINKVLKCADNEIKILKIKAEKLKQQKKGLMQVLLTGKNRLKIDAKA